MRYTQVNKWISEYATHTSSGGKHYFRKPFTLLPWQKKLIKMLLQPDINRVFIAKCRKIGATEIAIAIAFAYLLMKEFAPSRVIWISPNKESTSNLGRVGIMDMWQGLAKEFRSEIKPVREGFMTKSGSRFSVVSAEPRSLHGLNADLIIIDELHGFTSEHAIDVVLTSQVKRDSKALIITTPADPTHFAYRYYERAKKNEGGGGGYMIFGAKHDADPADPKTWKKANPSYGIVAGETYYKKELDRAKRSTAGMFRFRTLVLGQWLKYTKSRWLDWSKVSIADRPKEYELFGGLDLSITTDLTAYALLYKHDYGIHLEIHYFIPQEQYDKRVQLDSEWRNYLGCINICAGASINYGQVMQKIKELERPMDIGYDPYNAKLFADTLNKDGYLATEVRQGGFTMTAPIRELERAVANKEVTYDGNPLTLWCFNNVAVSDKSNYITLHKTASIDRIDGATAEVDGRNSRHAAYGSILKYSWR